MPSQRAFFSRTLAIIVATCGVFAMGCGSNDAGAADDTGLTADDDGGISSTPAPPDVDAGANSDATAPPSVDAGGCPLLTFPSGVEIQSFENAKMTATYADHLASGEKAPTCFLDVTNLLDPKSGKKYDLSVNVATNFQLEELVGTEVDEGYGNIVLMQPAAVDSLQKFRDEIGGPVSVNSGFRSPKHQEDVCNSLCGNPLGCDGTCANNSRHMFGDAFDLPLDFYNSTDEHYACDAGFKFAYLESGTHLHIDQNPEYATCEIE